MMKTKMYAIVDRVKDHAAALKLTAATTALMAVPSMMCFASEPSGGSNLLTGELMTALQTGVGDLKSTAVAIIGVVVVAAVGILGLSKGSDFALKKIKGVLNKAS